MKYWNIFLLAISLLLSLAVHAQKLTVEGMTASSVDLSASQFERKDLAGQVCGMVKVQLAAAGAQFEGNVIGTPEYKTGEYWVYMSPGSYMLNIKHPQFVPLNVNFRDYGVQGIQSKVTYLLTLSIPSSTPQDIDDGMRYLAMTVEPSNATVYIDGKRQVVQNGMVSLRLPMGSHSYQVEAGGYVTKTGSVDLSEGRQSLTVRLESSLAQVTIKCGTPGAKIYVNDQLRGTSPWSGELGEGNYLVEARQDGHRPQKQSVTLKEREQRTITLPELVSITGSLDVNYQPMDAEVWLDGKKIGVSPDIFRNIIVGNHKVELRATGYHSQQHTITIEEGKTANLTGALEKGATAATAQTSGNVKPVTNYTIREAKRYEHVSGPALMTYNIVAGSYGLRSNAEGQAERLKQNGYSTSPTIIKDGMMYRVI